MSEKQAPLYPQRVTVFNATVSAKPATPEQIRAERESLKLKEQDDGPRNSSPL